MRRLFIAGWVVVVILFTGNVSANGEFWGDLQWGESVEAISERHPWWSVSTLGGYRGDLRVYWFRGIPEDLSVPEMFQGLLYSDEVQYWFYKGGLASITAETKIRYSPTLEDLQRRSVGIHHTLRDYYGEPNMTAILRQDPETGQFTERVDHLYEDPDDIPNPWMLQLVWFRKDIDTTIAFSFISHTNYVMVDLAQSSVVPQLNAYMANLSEADYDAPEW